MKIDEAKEWLQMTSEATDLLSGEIEAAKLAVRLMEREPLVQEVIRLRQAMYPLVERGAPEGILLDAGRNIIAAVDKLVEWKP